LSAELPAVTARQVARIADMSLAVHNPMINSPFEEPSRWWDYSEGQPALREGRRA
jgi:hypothetical protein